MGRFLKTKFLAFLSCVLLLTTVVMPKSVVNAQEMDGIFNNSIKILAYKYPIDFKQEWVEFRFVPEGNGTAKLKCYIYGEYLSPDKIASNLVLYADTLFEISNIYGFSGVTTFNRGTTISSLAKYFESLTFTYGVDYVHIRSIPILELQLPPVPRYTINDYEEYEKFTGIIYDEGFSGARIEGPVFGNLANRNINDDLRFSGVSKLFRYRIEKEGLYQEYRKQVKIPDGEYIIQTYENPNKVVQVNSSNAETGEYKGLNNQKWEFEYDNMVRAYKIKNGIGVLALDNKNNTEVVCEMDNNHGDQYWYIEDAGDGNYRLINASKIELRLNLDSNNKNLSIARNLGNSKQLFKLVKVNKEEALVNGKLKISPKSYDDKVLDLDLDNYSDNYNKSRLIISNSTNSFKQKWELEYNSNNDAFKIRNSDTFECLMWNPELGANVYAVGSLENNNQYWKLEDVGNGYFIIKNCYDSNMVLELFGGTVRVARRNNSDGQKWKFGA